MSLMITVPDTIAAAAQQEARVQGASPEALILAALRDRFGVSVDSDANDIAEDAYAPLRAMIGLCEGGRFDSSTNHDYRPDDPI